MIKRMTGMAMIAMALVGCGDAGDDNAGGAMQEVEVNFAALVSGEAFDCAGEYELGTAGTPAKITDLRFYVSDVSLVRDDGERVNVELTSDGKWQNDSVALLDFEDGTGACDNGNPDINTSVIGQIPEGNYDGVEFVLGVPFGQNHQNQATADPPLNLASMFWNWQGGYKFFRLDGIAEESAGFRVHLGSTACESQDGSNEVSACGKPNRARIRLMGFDPASDAVSFDAAEIYTDIDMTPDAENKSAICMASPDHAVCGQVFPKFGLEFGSAENTGQQAVFRVKSAQ